MSIKIYTTSFPDIGFNLMSGKLFENPNGTSTTVASTSTDENENKIFTGKAWINEDGTKRNQSLHQTR